MSEMERICKLCGRRCYTERPEYDCFDVYTGEVGQWNIPLVTNGYMYGNVTVPTPVCQVCLDKLDGFFDKLRNQYKKESKEEKLEHDDFERGRFVV